MSFLKTENVENNFEEYLRQGQQRLGEWIQSFGW